MDSSYWDARRKPFRRR